MKGYFISESDMALNKTGVSQVKVRLKPRLLSDNGPCYISKDLRDYLEVRDLKHIRSAPYHPQTQGKIERYHRSIKNVINLQHYYFPGELEQAVREFVEYYNHQRYHELLDNLTPADVYYGRDKNIIIQREILKEQTLQMRRSQNLGRAVSEILLDYENCIS